MAGKIAFTFADVSGENSRSDVLVPDLTAGNIAGIMTNADPDQAGTLGAAIAALSLCQLSAYSVTATAAQTAQAAATDMYAQRELGLMVSYRDTVTGRLYRFTIPGPDWANLGLAGSDQVNPAAAAWTAFVTEFEGQAVSQDDNPVEVISGRLVGRSR